ncbi:MAG: IS1595 family transposase [Acidimicrobiales bacterium]
MKAIAGVQIDRPATSKASTAILAGAFLRCVAPDHFVRQALRVESSFRTARGSELWTDEGKWYRQLGEEFIRHATVNHIEDEYVSRATGASTNKAENFFSQLKRSLDGTHHHVSVEHLPRYLSEFDYRFSTRKLSDGERMAQLVRRAEGRRLTYKRVKAA